jgi:cytidine deaminase
MIDDSQWEELFQLAYAAREQAYAPYSKFKVGAAALFDDGTVTVGCNMENASYGLAMCAERNAIGAGVVQGKRGLLAVAIVGQSPKPVPPCGMCRQVMAEFRPKRRDVQVRLRNLKGGERRYKLKQLLPYAFTPKFL